MKTLITGGAGFIGTNLSKSLLDEGHQVTVVDNFLTGSASNAEHLKHYKDYKLIEIGIESPKFAGLLASDRFDQIFHLACPTGVPNIEKLGEEMIDTCSVGTKNVLQLARQYSTPIVFTSSSEIYGNPLVSPQSEEYSGNVNPQGFRANYEEGKRFSETLMALFARKYSVPAKTVRLFNMYGPLMHLSDFRVIPRFITQALDGKEITIYGDGSQRRTLCFVADLIDALKRVMSKGEIGGIYNIGSTDEITIRQFAEMVIEYTGSKSELVFMPDMRKKHNDTDFRMPNLGKIKGLGWEQKISLPQGLSFTIDDFRARLGRSIASTSSLEPAYAQAARTENS